MATKVKGDAIKEGSIPLSALSNEVKDKIENAGGGADWNANEGESGYIKNRTHYNKIKENPVNVVEYNNIEYNTDDNGNLTGYFIFDDRYAADYNDEYNELILEGVNGTHEGRKIVLHKGDRIDVILGRTQYELSWSDYGFDISFTTNNEEDYEYFEYDWSCFEYYLQEIKQLDEYFIPDTIARKSEVQGIDPVVWKYICNPCIIKSGVKVPEELIGTYSEDIGPYNEDIDGYEGGYCLKYPIFAMYKIMITSEHIDLEYGSECTAIITPTNVTKEYIELSELYVSKDYGIVFINVCIDKNKKWKFFN